MTDLTDAAGRIAAFLDALPERDDHESADILLTQPDPNPERGRWLHLTRADLRELLVERAELATRIDMLEAEYTDLLIADGSVEWGES